MKTIIGVSGSLRKGSFNSAVLREAARSAPEGVKLEIKSIAGIPLYNGDDEAASGVPQAARELKDAIAAADGLLILTPEYNNSMPGVLKNAIDWLSRPPADAGRVFGGKPVAVGGASPGGFGTVLSQSAWLPVLKALGTKPWWGGALLVSRAHQALGPDGEIADPAVKERIREFVAGFAASL
jgi:NAD(P)H-dependent FMN reductase